MPAVEEKLKSPEQLPDIEGRKLAFTWDQEGEDSVVRCGERIVWRERTGSRAQSRFGEIAAILQRKYGSRIKDLVPTPAAEAALYGEDRFGPSYVQGVRAHLASGKFKKYTYFELEKAVHERNSAALRHYLLAGGNASATHDRSGATLLHLAARWHFPEIVRLLIEGGAKLNALDRSGNSPLREALDWKPFAPAPGSVEEAEQRAKRLEVVKLLVEAGANTDGLNRRVSNLSPHGRFVYNPPLEMAAQQGDIDVVRYLLERGAKVDITDADGSTPLHTAVNYGHLEIVRAFVAAGADVNRPDPLAGDMTPLLRAVSPIERKEYAAEMIRLLVQAGADPNQGDARGGTPLLSAIDGCKFDLVSLLLSLGADVHRCDEDGDGPLAHAVLSARPDYRPQEQVVPIIQALRAAGADPGVRNKEGKSVRDLADEMGLASLQSLLQRTP